jgi:hypothetical protein
MKWCSNCAEHNGIKKLGGSLTYQIFTSFHYFNVKLSRASLNGVSTSLICAPFPWALRVRVQKPRSIFHTPWQKLWKILAALQGFSLRAGSECIEFKWSIFDDWEQKNMSPTCSRCRVIIIIEMGPAVVMRLSQFIIIYVERSGTAIISVSLNCCRLWIFYMYLVVWFCSWSLMLWSKFICSNINTHNGAAACCECIFCSWNDNKFCFECFHRQISPGTWGDWSNNQQTFA